MPSTAKKSGNPAKRAAAKRAAVEPQSMPATTNGATGEGYGQRVWAKTQGGEFNTELTLPSGEVILVRRPGVEGLIAAGVLHNTDGLSALVDNKHLKRVKGQPQVDVESLMKDQKNITSLLHMIDRTTCYCVVKPTVLMTPNDPTNRKDGDHVYCDQIPLEDRLFILDYVVGGSADLERFRRETSVAVGSLADEQGVSQDAG